VRYYTYGLFRAYCIWRVIFLMVCLALFTLFITFFFLYYLLYSARYYCYSLSRAYCIWRVLFLMVCLAHFMSILGPVYLWACIFIFGPGYSLFSFAVPLSGLSISRCFFLFLLFPLRLSCYSFYNSLFLGLLLVINIVLQNILRLVVAFLM